MSGHATLLLEIGTEELPPKSLRSLSEALAAGLRDSLQKNGLGAQRVAGFCSPRRLAVLAQGVPLRQPDRLVERKGPSLQAAFDESGEATKAAQGFARSCGVAVNDLERSETDKGTWLVYRTQEQGRTAQTAIPELAAGVLAALPLPKRMRWSDFDTEFVRPVHWVVLMLDEEVLDAELLGVRAANLTRGHRAHVPDALVIERAGDYAHLLESKGYVIADFGQRKAKIAEQVAEQARAAGAQALSSDDLLDEVTALVEWPVALTGSFEPEFLRVPAEALISTMQGNQKYFPLVDENGALLPKFITIANLESRDPESVRAGNERVVRARLADAGFFWDQDRKQTLEQREAQLAGVVFQKKLGTLEDKRARVSALIKQLAAQIDCDVQPLMRAARIAKCDLLTEMVGEFPELQGTMGRYYALNDGEPEDVARALEEQYLPRFAGDAIPSSALGRALALAERLDTLAGIFAIGQKPSGEKDPFALRRAALGVLRILIEGELPLDVFALIEHAIAGQPVAPPAGLAEQLFDFMMERLRSYYHAKGVTAQHLEAVLARRPHAPLDFHKRLQAVVAFTELPESVSLAAANKRIRNILRQAGEVPEVFVEERLREPAERLLAEQLHKVQDTSTPLFQRQDYTGALTEMASLRDAVDGFFDQVLVMDDDRELRDNRIALLNSLSLLFLQVADVSLLPSDA
ncbi:MAG: glycine--tRNA ligase subunit beta [Gammaproteobacteria bacterium]|nr:glycine--tRNA ligase subunit beta [Gammaproteobacteria bacterium]